MKSIERMRFIQRVQNGATISFAWHGKNEMVDGQILTHSHSKFVSHEKLVVL